MAEKLSYVAILAVVALSGIACQRNTSNRQVSSSKVGEFICADGWRRVPPAGPYGLVTWAACLKRSPVGEAITWTQARDACRSQSSHLMTLDDEFLVRHVTNEHTGKSSIDEVIDHLRQFAIDNGLFSDTWIGLYGNNDQALWEADVPKDLLDSNQSRIYRWATGSGNSPDWSAGSCVTVKLSVNSRQQSNDNSKAPDRPFVLTTENCERRLQYVCLKPASNVIVQPELGLNDHEGRWDVEWLGSTSNNFCYLPGPSRLRKASFNDANNFCKSLNGWLATPTDSFQHNFTTAAFIYPEIRTSVQIYPGSSQREPLSTPTPVVTLSWSHRCRKSDQARSYSRDYHPTIAIISYGDAANTGQRNWTCPPATRLGRCHQQLCQADNDCRNGEKKCCSDGCMRQCLRPISALASSDSMSVFWIGLYSNRTTALGERWSYVYGDVIDDKGVIKQPLRVGDRESSGCLAVVMAGNWPIIWSIRNCQEQHRFLCQKPVKTMTVNDNPCPTNAGLLPLIDETIWTRTGPARITVDPSDLRLRRSEFLNATAKCLSCLVCKASNFDPSRPVVWVYSTNNRRVRRYVNNGLPPNGFRFDIRRLHQILGGQHPGELQGYYHCEVWGSPAAGRVSSREALFTLTDVITFRSDFMPPYPTTTERFTVGSMTVVDSKQGDRSVYINTTTDQTTSGNDVTDHVYREAVRSFANKKFGNVILRRTDKCGPGVSSEDQTTGPLTVTFPVTSFDQTAFSREVCVYDGVPLAIGKCTGDFVSGGVWTNLTYHTCVEQSVPLAIRESRVTKTLLELDSARVSPANVETTTSTLANLTRDHHETMTSLDLAFTSSLLRKIAALPTDDEISDDFLDIVDRLVDINDTILQEAENMSSGASRIVEAVELFTENVALDPKGSKRLTISRPNVDVHIFDVPIERSESNANVSNTTNQHQSVYGMKLTRNTGSIDKTDRRRPDGDENMEFYRDPVSVDDVVVQNVEGAILLSREAIEMARQNSEKSDSASLHEQNSSSFRQRRSVAFGADSFRLSFVVYRKSELFQQRHQTSSKSSQSVTDELGMPSSLSDQPGQMVVNSLVISAAVNGIEIYNLTDPVVIILRLREPGISSSPHSCAFWDTSTSGDGTIRPRWSTEGVITDTSQLNDSNVVICYSRHLTNFAVIAGFDGLRRTTIAKVLEAISIVGVLMSIIGLLLTILSQIVMFASLRRARSQMVLLHLSVSLLAVDLIVIAGVDKTESDIICRSVAGLLLYFLLVSFSWMLVEAVVQYLKFVKVFNTHTSKFMVKTALPAYLVPGLIVAAVVYLDLNTVNLLRGPKQYCWLSRDGFYYAFLLPLGLIMFTNVILFIFIVKGLTCDRPQCLQSNQAKKEMIRLQVLAVICCFVLMGMTWTFALFAIGSAATTMQILFCIFNSLQGFAIFAFVNIRERLIRQAWLKLFRQTANSLGLRRRRYMRNVESGSSRPGSQTERGLYRCDRQTAYNISGPDAKRKHGGVQSKLYCPISTASESESSIRSSRLTEVTFT